MYMYMFIILDELYKDVKEDYFSFNKIPRILFLHKQRYVNM